MIEEIIVVGNCPENKWRRDNLLKCKNVVEMEKHYQLSFSFVEGGNPPKNIKLIYHILK